MRLYLIIGPYILIVAYIEGDSNTADTEHINLLDYEIQSDPDPQRVSNTSFNDIDGSEMPEIQSDPDPQRVAITSSNNTDDSEMPLLSLSDDVEFEVETPEEYKEYSMCRFK